MQPSKAWQNIRNECPRGLALDWELLWCNILQQSRAWLLAHPEYSPSDEQWQTFRSYWRRRSAGEPLAYILGRKEFWSLDLRVNASVLIPRPESELLVELCLEMLPNNDAIKIIDLGCGSGALALALAHERPSWQLTATDISPAALAVARTNSESLGIRLQLLESNWLLDVPRAKGYQAIIANPPYLAAEDPHLQQLAYEPRQALVSTADGMGDLCAIIKQSRDYLTAGGLLALEHGCEQGAAVRAELARQGYNDIATKRDYAGLERVSYGVMSSARRSSARPASSTMVQNSD